MSKRTDVAGATAQDLPSLGELLPQHRIRVGVEAGDWRAAVRVAGQLLLDSHVVSAEYIEAMVRTAEELEQYIVIAPGIALPHARPEDGALATGLSLIILREPVPFGHPRHDPVRLVFALSAVDKTVHVRAMKVLANLLLSGDAVHEIETADSPAAVYALITRMEEEVVDD